MQFRSARRPSLLLASCAAIGLGASATTALSQEQEEEGEFIEELIVTATKRAESVQDVALSITAVSGSDLLDRGIVDIAGLDRSVPGFQFGQSGNDARPAVRGTRTEFVIGNAEPLVSFYNDGVYRSRPGQAFAAFVDSERVEVLRGPQGTFFGRNTFGGAINVISNKPTTEGIEAGADVVVQNFNGLRANAFVNVPLSDTLSFRLSGYRDRRDGYVENTFDPSESLRDVESDYIRGQLRWEPNEKFDVIVRADQFESGGNGSGAFGFNIIGTPINADGLTDGVGGTLIPTITDADGDPSTPGGVVLSSPDGLTLPGGQAADPGPLTIARNGDAIRDVNQTTVSAEASYDLGFAEAKFIFGYADYSEFRQDDGDFTIIPDVLNANLVTAETFTEELQFTSLHEGPFEWVIGAFFLQDESSDAFFQFNDTATEEGPGPQTFVTSQTVLETDSFAGYADGSYAIIPSFRIIGGIRFTSDQRRVVATAGDGVDVTTFTGAPGRVEEATFNEVTWRAGLEYDLTEETLLYAQVSTGFLAGSFNSGLSPEVPSFGEQTVLAVEAGVKSRFDLGNYGVLTANLVGFYNDFDDLLNQVLDPVTLLSFAANAGTIRSFGIEGEFSWLPTENSYIDMNFAYNDSEFQDFIIPNPFEAAPDSALVPATIGTGPGVLDLSGLEVPLNPDFTLNINAGYTFDFGDFGRITPSVNFNFSDGYRTSDEPFVGSDQDSFTKTDLRVTWESQDGHFSGQAFVQNVEDEIVLLRTLDFGADILATEFGEPRFYGVRLSYRY